MAVITREEFSEWLELAATKAVKAQVQADLTRMTEMLYDADESNLKEIQGRCKACMNFLDIAYEDVV